MDLNKKYNKKKINTLLIKNFNYINFFDNVMEILHKETKDFFVPVVSKLDLEGVNPFIILISTVMSLRTKDQVTLDATIRLMKYGTTPEEIIKLSEEKIKKIIYPVGFYKTKAKRIIEICKILIQKYNGKTPANMEKLLDLPGVGRKTANLVLAVGFKLPGMCVDTHVHRISNRFGIINTKNAEETEFALREVLPIKYWEKYNEYLVSWGQNICKPISPFCSKCRVKPLCKQKGVKKYR